MTNHLHLAGRDEKAAPKIPAPLSVTSARVWHCKYSSLSWLGALRNLRVLVVLTYPDNSLAVLSELRELRYLRLGNFPKVRDLSPLVSLTQLETLSLETPAEWDSRRKYQAVESLEPIAGLPKLRHLQLFGVVPPDRSLTPLHSARQLETARFSAYDAREVARFRAATGARDEFNPEPVFADPGT